jgi:hypothetical protein
MFLFPRVSFSKLKADEPSTTSPNQKPKTKDYINGCEFKQFSRVSSLSIFIQATKE